MQDQIIDMPKALGEARLLKWLVQVGDTITPTTPLARVLTDDAEWVIPARWSGVVVEHLVREGESIPAGRALARCTATPRLRATPLARRVAAMLGIDLTKLTGSGPAGRIGRADVIRAAGLSIATPVSLPTPQPETSVIVTRHTVPAPTAAHGAETAVITSSVTVPGVTFSDLIPVASVTVAIDLQLLLQRCAGQSAMFAAYSLQSSPLSALIATAASIFPLHPLINATWSDTAIVIRHRYHVAAGLPNGRWVLIRDAGDLTERGIARALNRENHDLQSATCAVAVTADWWRLMPPLPGTAAAITLSEARLQPVALTETSLQIGAVAQLSVCYDARILDHPTVMAFLTDLCDRLGCRTV
ncbi:E3 binding domain-containing protein [Chloroflexus sp. Y-396-1]|uniref:E3 binding domain-containing protein n=1 Tax=Chloroflexus sp. Y-396-1 TaxID=867845 RepID=UPI000491BA40|nr:E3 binding domain-containing protein [Chloroflexus sp. Y-396-1]